MLVPIYAIYDKCAEQASQIFGARNDAVALRAFNQAVKDAVNPNEYQLFMVGEFDDEKVMLFGRDGRPREIVPSATVLAQAKEVN